MVTNFRYRNSHNKQTNNLLHKYHTNRKLMIKNHTQIFQTNCNHDLSNSVVYMKWRINAQTGYTKRRMIPIVFEMPLALVKEFLNPPDALMCSCNR